MHYNNVYIYIYMYIYAQHFSLLNRYAELVGKKQIFEDSYDQVISQAPASKILIFSTDADTLLGEVIYANICV
jgi:hypothetical protein